MLKTMDKDDGGVIVSKRDSEAFGVRNLYKNWF